MKTTYFKRFTRLFVVMLLAMLPAMSWAQTYISEVAVSCRASYSAAYADLEGDGFTKYEFGWNSAVTPCSVQGVIMGYKTTTDPTQAITNLIVMEGEEYKCDGTNKQMIIDGKVYRPIKAFGNANTNGDFNSGCASTASKLYVWYTKDVTGDPQVIQSVNGLVSATALSSSTYAKLYSNGTVTANANLNKGAGGNYQYISMTKTKPANATFKRNFTTFTNPNNTGKAYLRFYDIAKYFDVDVPDGEENVNSIFISDITIDGKSISFRRTFQDDKSIWAGNDVTVTTLGSNVKGGTKKTGFPIDSSHKYRFEINYPHQNVKDIKISGEIEIQVDKREKKRCNWEFVLHKELDMYFTYPYHTANGQLYLRYSDIFRFLGYDVSEGALNSFRPLVAQVDGAPCAEVSQQEITGLGNAKGVRVGTYSDAGVTIRTVNTSYSRGLIADDVPSGQEDRYGVTITYPRNQSKKFALQMYVAYTYTTNSTYASNEEEDYKMFYVVLSPDPDRVNQLRFCNSNTNNTAATAPLTGKIGEPINLFTYSPNSITRTYSITSSNASNATLSRNSVNGAGYGAFTFTATKPGTYTVATSQVGGDGYFPSTATRSIEIQAPTLSPVKAVKPNVELDLKSFFKYYPSGMNATFTCSDANATINGTTFSSAVEGEYIVNVSVVPTTTCGISINEQVKVIVSRHNYPYYEFKAHLDFFPPLENRSYFNHKLSTFYLPAWDFEAPVCGKNVRFCINDDDKTVTLVCGTPIEKGYFFKETDNSLYGKDHADGYKIETNQIFDYLLPCTFFSTKNSILDFQHAVEPLYFDVNYASAYCIDAAELIIPEKVTYGGKEYTVTKIGDGAFGQEQTDDYHIRYYLTETYFVCRGTESITLPSSIKEIGHNAFRHTTASSVNFKDLVNLETIGTSAFYFAQNLEQVDLTKCEKLESIGAPVGGTFCGNKELKTVNMSGLQNLKYLGGQLFENCSLLQSLDLSNCAQLTEIPFAFCMNCRALRLPNMDNSPIIDFGVFCYEGCNFNGQTFDMRRLASSETDVITLVSWCFQNTGLKNLIVSNVEEIRFIQQCFRVTGDKPMIENIFIPKCSKIYLDIDDVSGLFNHSDGTVNKGLRIFMRYDALTSNYWIKDDIEDFGDEHGQRVFPILSSNTSGFRTMSYFRPLDYKNIKVFDNTHLYDANKPGGGDYELEDFFRTDLTGIKMLTPYTATGYNVENKQVTMTELAAAPGIEAKGGIYYKGTGTSTDGAGNEILYILTEPNYSLVGENKSYANMYSGVNYLKGGGKDAVNMAGAPHMTDESTQFISKGGTFYYSTPGTLAAYKAYLDLPEFIKTAADTDYSSSAKVTSLSFVWEDEPMQESETITSVNAISENRNGDIYNLQGMKVKTPQRSGLYISNGRKVLVK